VLGASEQEATTRSRATPRKRSQLSPLFLALFKSIFLGPRLPSSGADLQAKFY
jgi:hypothetical protein